MAFDANPTIGPLTFQLLAHCALQTKLPVQVYSRATEWLRTHLVNVPPGPDTNTIYSGLWPQVQRACYEASLEEGLSGLVPAMNVVDNTPLRGNMVFEHYRMIHAFAAHTTSPEKLEMAFAIPGIARRWLFDLFPPPLVRFQGGHWSGGTKVQLQAVEAMSFTPEAKATRLEQGPNTPEFRAYLEQDTPQAYIERLANHSAVWVAGWSAVRLQRFLRRKREALAGGTGAPRDGS
jgi:hypothetical protein